MSRSGRGAGGAGVRCRAEAVLAGLLNYTRFISTPRFPVGAASARRSWALSRAGRATRPRRRRPGCRAPRCAARRRRRRAGEPRGSVRPPRGTGPARPPRGARTPLPPARARASTARRSAASASGSRFCRARSKPCTRWDSGSYQRSCVRAVSDIASSTVASPSSTRSCRSSASASKVRNHGADSSNPSERHAAMPPLISSMASSPSPASLRAHPRRSAPIERHMGKTCSVPRAIAASARSRAGPGSRRS